MHYTLYEKLVKQWPICFIPWDGNIHSIWVLAPPPSHYSQRRQLLRLKSHHRETVSVVSHAHISWWWRFKHCEQMLPHTFVWVLRSDDQKKPFLMAFSLRLLDIFIRGVITWYPISLAWCINSYSFDKITCSDQNTPWYRYDRQEVFSWIDSREYHIRWILL